MRLGPVKLISAESTELFVGPDDDPLQLVAVTHSGTGSVAVDVAGAGLETPAPPTTTGDGRVDVPVRVRQPVPGEQRSATVRAGGSELAFTFAVAEPGWTMFMVSHFHYDPVWWNTQAAYTSVWTADPPGDQRQTNGFALVRAHLEMARREPEYKFVLAEVDYLKPYWDAYPEDRADLRRLMADGRVEIMGGTYNEPNTNLTDPETAIRNFVHGIGFQRDVMGADPATAWQLDVFGHDPQFPGMAADAGLTSSSWARGPHHQWGPMERGGDPRRMQFASEFEWIAPSGRGLLTHYMPAHYAGGWWIERAVTLEDAEAETFRLFRELKSVAATRNVLLPVGTDYTPPNKWVTDIHRDWNSRYTWPKFVCAVPADFFGAVRAELAARGAQPSPQSRDMNPIYTGKDVSFIDTKQANRDAELAVLDAEKFGTFAALLTRAGYPDAALAKAWAQLAYGAHHDAITGSESDQVYIDLLTSWRDAWDLGRRARDGALSLLSHAVDGHAVVWNSLSHNRTDVVTVRIPAPEEAHVRVLDADGAEVPCLVEHDGGSVTFLARDVPAFGWRAYTLDATDASAGWARRDGADIANEYYRVSVDPARGGCVSSLVRAGRELLADGAVGNELAVYDEYRTHPRFGEGPWHLIPRGKVVGAAEAPAHSVAAFRSPVAERLVVRGAIGTVLRYTQTLTLWQGVDRVDCDTTIDEFTGKNRLVRLRWPCPVPGALPVSEVGDAVIGRGFGLLHDPVKPGRSVDTKKHPWTLENPAYSWFGSSSAARVRVGDDVSAVSVAEVIAPSEATSAAFGRDLVVALARAGVTATCSGAERPRYGNLDVDSNLPDARIALGGPGENGFTAEVFANADRCYEQELARQLAAGGRARVWVPAVAPLAEAWVPGADLRGARALPVLVVAADDLAGEVAALVDDLVDAEIVVDQDVPAGIATFESRTVALLNRGVPSFAVTPDGTLHTSLMRSCTAWPSGVWIDRPRRTAPDGSNFQLQHWSHTFDYALTAGPGDWREAAICARSAEFSNPLRAVLSGRSQAPLPSSGSLIEVESSGAVRLAAVKAAGNPLTRSSARSADPRRQVALRLVETHGGTADVAVRSALGAVSTPQRANLLEEPGDATDALALTGYEIATVLTVLDVAPVLDAADPPQELECEPAQPLYARYWLHNRGPAPLGGLPVVAHLHPHDTRVAAGAVVPLRLTVASDCTDAALGGQVRLLAPPGWSVAPAELPFRVDAGGHLEAEVTVTVPSGTADGLYPVRAQLTVTGDVRDAWRQTVEDVCVVAVRPEWSPPRGRLLRIVRNPAAVDVSAGDSATLRMAVGTDAHADLAAEAHLVTPWGTWDWVGPAVRGIVLPARGTADVEFDVQPPAWVRPGRWWALIRVAAAGRLVYSKTVELRVR